MTDNPTALNDTQEFERPTDRRWLRWFIPLLTGFVAFLVGLAAGDDGDDVEVLEDQLAAADVRIDEAESEITTLGDDLATTEQDLADAVAGHDQREAELNDRAGELAEQQAEIEDRNSALAAREDRLDDRAERLDARKDDLDARETDLAQREAGADEPSSTDVYYENCDAARAAGAAPVRRGDPGYGPHLDRDDDGIGCE